MQDLSREKPTTPEEIEIEELLLELKRNDMKAGRAMFLFILSVVMNVAFVLGVLHILTKGNVVAVSSFCLVFAGYIFWTMRVKKEGK